MGCSVSVEDNQGRPNEKNPSKQTKAAEENVSPENVKSVSQENEKSDSEKSHSSSSDSSERSRNKSGRMHRAGSVSHMLSSKRRSLTLQENLVQNNTTEDIRNVYNISLNKQGNGKVLGTGMSGAVRQIKRISDGKVFALKTISLSQISDSSLEELQNEVNILKCLDHTHIAKLYETYEDPGIALHMVLELCTGGELFDKLMEEKRFGEHKCASIITKMLSALNYLHCKNTVHRDLKLENWLFRSEKDQDIVLIDFGLSHKYKAKEKMHSKVGTSYYIAPEVLQGNYTSACDMWSMGVIAFMLLSGSAPFGGEDDDQIIRNVIKHKYSMKRHPWEKISDHGKDFVKKLLQPDPEKRMTAAVALKHPWITKEAQEHPPPEIDTEVFKNIRKFKRFHELKRVAIEIVAFSLEHEEIKNLHDVFDTIDNDHNGFITFRELKEAMIKSRTPIPEKELHEIFDAIDEEHTGLIHANEFIAATLQEKYYMDEHYLHDAFHKMDSNNTGFITVDNLKDLLGSCINSKRAEEILDEASINHSDGDHKISYKMFLKFMRQDGEKNVQHVVKRRKSEPAIEETISWSSSEEKVSDDGEFTIQKLSTSKNF